MSNRSPGGFRGPSALLRPALLSTTLLDEVLSGLFVIALPLMRRDLGLTYTQAGLIFTVGDTAAMLFGPVLSLLSDRYSKRIPVVGGLLCLAVGFAMAATAHSFVALLLAMLLISPANSAAVGLAQAALIDHAPADVSRTMTRWTLMAAIGDLLSPLLVAAWTAAGLAWRPLYWLGAGIWLAASLCLLPLPFPQPPHAVESSADLQVGVAGQKPSATDGPTGSSYFASLRAELKTALRNTRLWCWIAVLVMCNMVDETFLGFAALFLADALHLPTPVASLVLGAHMVGALLGLLLLDRLHDRIDGPRLLPALAGLALIGTMGFLATRSAWTAGTALFLMGLGTSGWYPIAKAAAYQTLPGRTGTVRAVYGLTGPLDAAIPALAGALASRFGVLAGVGFLGIAPLGVLLFAPQPSKKKE